VELLGQIFIELHRTWKLELEAIFEIKYGFIIKKLKCVVKQMHRRVLIYATHNIQIEARTLFPP
jgi:hypothetical protein